ncbi:putative DNA helicase INO80 [Eurytemora carolleeae]|uniref:putative DNA helicase INO80 n=1 Tax=Eurytemora carolleeae TaxID=1294199 RepID=UPI000C760119|nr:putative DNA helicase INO80 [Eurytemora carolleeae]|eukprot:XP_023325573.1 putative DNA helicase INO80 [Eurytemora affinis]
MEEAERKRKKIEEEQEEEEEEGETDEENDEDEEDVVVHLQLTQPDPGPVKDPTLQDTEELVKVDTSGRNIARDMLKEYNWRMKNWRDGELKLLVKEQESAVAAVRLEKLIGKYESSEKRIRQRSSSTLMSEKERRKVRTLIQSTKPWLNPNQI